MTMLRRSLLKASQSPWLRERAPRYGFMRRTVTRFMPGEDAADALAASRRLAENGIATVLTHLGENVADRAEAEAVTLHYLDLIERIRSAALPAEVSVKLTQLGLDLDREFCYANLAKLIENTPAEKTLWIDMEQSPYVDATLELYRRARKSHRNVGVCLQAYLYRTEKDLDALIPLGASLRLVKGAYNEPAEIAFPKKNDVDENYFHLTQRLLSPEARRAGVRAAIATHDRILIRRLTTWAAAQGITNAQLEFQMLYGIQRAEQLRLAQEGYRSAVLISYGSFWFPWFMRRLAERPANILFLARNFFSR
ncbi:MAG TPA: proline dehydrogenase family protein [Candidatus Angelobacter sp.]|jgi:proline dehydrogenase|nr:proline dehydrogenase family protein [Candidatus Angelobacter sp.]